MRKNLIISASLAVAAAAVLSCAKEADINTLEKAPKGDGITINVISGSDATKTAAVDGEIPTIQWVSTDNISLFEVVDGTITGVAQSGNADIDGEGKASFSTTLDWADAGGSAYQYSAVYPAGNVVSSGGKYYIILPPDQSLTGNNFSADSDVLFSTPLDHGSARATDGEDIMFTFRRLGTVIRLTLSGITSGEKISQITLTGPTDIAGAIEYDPVTSTVNPESAFAAYSSDTINLYLDNLEATGNDVVWFRLMSDEDWAAGETFTIKVITDKNIYNKTVTLPSAIKFPDGGLTKFGVSLASARVEPVSVPCLWDFENGAENWTFWDLDGDGYDWIVTDEATAHSGSFTLTSQSYINYVGALEPDNLAWTPPVQLTEGNYLGFWVRAEFPNYPEEHYAVYLAKDTPNGEISILQSETVYPEGSYAEIGTDGYYQHFVIQIPAEFDNEVVCIGFRHFNSTDQYWIDIDDVSITEDYPIADPTASYEDYLGVWAEGLKVYTVEQKVYGESYSISGLTGQGDYAVEAKFENHRMVLYTQQVYAADNTEVWLQGSDGYLPAYPDGTPASIFHATKDETENKLTVTPLNGNQLYIFITYENQTNTSYAYDDIPSVLIPYVAPTASYEDYLGEWTDGSKVYTIGQKDEGSSYTVTGFTGQGSYTVEAKFESQRLVLYEQVVSSSTRAATALQGLTDEGFYTNYASIGQRIIFSALYDAEDDCLNITPENDFYAYIWINYSRQSYSSYGSYADIPSVLIPYVPVPDTNTYLFKDGFEEGATGWSFFDADGDTYGWSVSSTFTTHTGDNALVSKSWINSTVGGVRPDNYAFTPAITLGADNYLSFWVSASQGYPDEHYAIYVTAAAPANDNLPDSNPIFEQTYSKTASVGGTLVELGTGGYQHYVIPIEGFDNQTVYIGFRHFDCYDNEYLVIDDLGVIEGTPVFAAAPAHAPAKKMAAASAAPSKALRKDASLPKPTEPRLPERNVSWQKK